MHESIHDAFVAAFLAEVKGFKMGDPMDESTYIGAITRRPQLDVLKKQVADARKKGAKLLTGGSVVRGKGNWFEPTVFADVDHSMALMKDESFGPIIGIQAVADDEAAVDLMNDTDYGLTAGVYTTDPKRARKILGQVRCRQRLLELLRSRQPAAAVVGRRPFGNRPHAVHLRHPDVHAAESVASALAVKNGSKEAGHADVVALAAQLRISAYDARPRSAAFPGPSPNSRWFPCFSARTSRTDPRKWARCCRPGTEP